MDKKVGSFKPYINIQPYYSKKLKGFERELWKCLKDELTLVLRQRSLLSTIQDFYIPWPTNYTRKSWKNWFGQDLQLSPTPSWHDTDPMAELFACVFRNSVSQTIPHDILVRV